MTGPSAAAPRVSVVVVTYRSVSRIDDCLGSVLRSRTEVPLEVVVVDNGSDDGTADRVRDRFPDVPLIAARRNRGFAAGCNRGVEVTDAELVLLLNPDARLPPGTLAEMVDYLGRHPKVGIVGPALETPNGELQRDISATGLFPSFTQALFEYTRLGRWYPDSRWMRDYFLPDFDRRSVRRVAMVQGACLMVRREVLRRVGLLDEGFFLYFEETDLCKRADADGWEIHYLGHLAATHEGAGSSEDGRPLARQFIRSMYRFHRKHYGLAEAVGLWLVLAPYHVLKTVRMAVGSLRRPEDTRLREDLRTVAGRCGAHLRLMLGGP